MSNIQDVAELDERLSRPSTQAIETLQQIDGDILLLGAGGKMGPSLARMARRAADAADNRKSARRVIAVSRFRDSEALQAMHAANVETISGDLFDRRFVDQLPDVPNLIYMVGQKFGTSTAAGATWAANAFLPGVVCQKYSRSRIVSFSTGNVYPLVSVESGGSRETDPMQPLGEYAMSAVARERVFEYFSGSLQLPMVILRLNYAVEMRYGVLIDLATKIKRRQPISLAMGHFNCIWQGDANDLTLRSLPFAQSPPRVMNLTGPTVLCSRDVCKRLGELMATPVQFCDTEASTALLNNARATFDLLGNVEVSIDQLLRWTADWVSRDAPTWDRPTHFEVRDGKF